MIMNCCHLHMEPVQKRACCSHYFPMAFLLFICFLVGSPYIINYKRITPGYEVGRLVLNQNSSSCESHGKPSGSETLPQGIISSTSNLEMQPLWYSSRSSSRKDKVESSKSLLAIAVGIKQKKVVNDIVKKVQGPPLYFLKVRDEFIVIMQSWRGGPIVDEWRDLEWSDNVLHVSAINQTKWWFAKRFLHPDIVTEYSYIFLWDEDLGVENFHPGGYLSIIKKEGLEISQPALDFSKSQVHYQITARLRKGNVHRRTYKFSGGGRCYANSTAPPCTGTIVMLCPKTSFSENNICDCIYPIYNRHCSPKQWVEMMAPVFSRDAWRCVWHMIQNDLIHAWGLDTKLGYCTRGDRTKTVGVVDSEYIVHKGIPSLGGDIKSSGETTGHKSLPDASDSRIPARSAPNLSNARLEIRRRSYAESAMFTRRWKNAVATDRCWVDPYPSRSNSTS